MLKKLPKSKSTNFLKPNKPQNFQNIESLMSLSTAKIYKNLISRNISVPKSQNKWIEYYPFLEKANWKNIYLLPSQIVMDTYLITLQFKIVHRVFNCNYKLYLWNIKTCPNCDICQKVDNLEHFFYYCQETEQFWRQVENWLSNIGTEKIELTVLETLLGFFDYKSVLYYAINYVLIIAKYYINKTKKDGKELFFFTFLQTLKNKLIIEQKIYLNQNRSIIFIERYAILLESL